MDAEKKKIKRSLTALAALLLVGAFTASLFASLSSIGRYDGEIRVSKVTPGGLVSAGAPRSQLALKQMFDSMGTVNSNGNRTVYEPITEEYLSAVKERIKQGETPMLSVEEVLYIISDTVRLAEKYDGVKLHGIGTVVFRKGEGAKPIHLSSLENCRKIMQIRIYRIQNLCIPETTEWDGSEFIYYPDLATRNDGRRRFVFSKISDENMGSNIMFYPGNGQKIELYPSSEVIDLCNTKYMSISPTELTESEKDILSQLGYDYGQCRNVTPEYWRGLTECKLVVVAGRLIIIDPLAGRALDSAPDDMKTVSIALGDRNGDRTYELYFTAYSGDRGAAVRYAPGSKNVEILFYNDFCMGAYEDLDGSRVSFYRAEQVESGSYLNLLRRVGNSIEY